MKNSTKKILTVLIFIFLSAALCVTAAAKEDAIAFFAVNTDSAESESELGAVEWYKNGDGIYYIFLPTTADKSNLTVWFTASQDLMCGETQLISGEATDVFADGNSFTLTCGNSVYNVMVLQSDSVGTVYINTEAGNMDAVHADKEHKEPGDVRILDSNGDVLYDGVLDYIKGRGNSTWDHAKKPYNIKLDKKTDLFGMGKSKSWCLLANAGEASMLRNRIAYDLARNIGIETTSETYYVNLYLNGEYAGLYMLTEKVDIEENRIDIYDLEGNTEDINDKDLDEYKLAGKQNSREFGSIKYAEIPNNPDEITGGYLLELEKIYRYVNEPSGFISDIGQAVVVKTPEYASKAQVEYISNYYQDFEDALYSGTGYNSKGKHYSEYVDVDSLARMYVIYEFTSNFDGCSSSFYLWKDVDGKLTAGPLWDFDLSLGHAQANDLINHVPNVAAPDLLYTQTCFIGNHAENKKSFLAQAFSHNDFQEKVEQIWAEDFEAFYPQFTENIDTFKNEIQSAVVMNAIKWQTFGTSTNVNTLISRHNSNTDVIRNFVNERYPFLQKVFSNDTYFVKYDIGKYGKALVHDTTLYNSGDMATVLPQPTATTKDAVFFGWSTSPDGDGEIYAAGDKIIVTDNSNLYAQWHKKTTIKSALENFFGKISEFVNSIIKFFKEFFT